MELKEWHTKEERMHVNHGNLVYEDKWESWAMMNNLANIATNIQNVKYTYFSYGHATTDWQTLLYFVQNDNNIVLPLVDFILEIWTLE